MKWRIGGYGGTAVQALVSYYDRYGTTSSPPFYPVTSWS